jgi:DNA polymerase III epsilon subunit-like protein
MKKCRLCGKTGFFVGLTLNAEGYCPQCSKFYKEREAREALERQRRNEAEAKTWATIEAIPRRSIVVSDSVYKRQSGYEGPKFSNITPKGKYEDVVVFDTETTGLAPSRDRILEIAAIRYINEKPVELFQTFINPGIDIPETSIKINEITPDKVKNAPSIGSVLPAFDDFVGGSTLVAHNLDYDLRFIYYSGSQVFNTKRKYIDTLE